MSRLEAFALKLHYEGRRWDYDWHHAHASRYNVIITVSFYSIL